MRARLDRKQFVRLIKTAATVARAGDERPVLRNILLETNSSEVALSATDMQASVRLRLPTSPDVEVYSEGRVLVPAQNLQRVVDAIPNSEVTIYRDGNECIVEAGEARFRLVTEDPRDFPKLHRFAEHQPTVEVPADQFVGILKRVVFCAHDERSYFNMHGLLLKVADNRITAVATNGQRLGIGSTDIRSLVNISDEGDLFAVEQVIPADSADILARLVDPTGDEQIAIQWFERSLRARGKYGEASLVALQGGFVPYEMGIPNNQHTLRIDRTEMLLLLKQISALKPAGDPFMLVTLGDNKLTIEADVRDVGSSKIQQDVKWEHDRLSVFLNPSFLNESMRVMNSDYVLFEFGGPMDQPVLREDSSGPLHSSCIYSVVREP